MTDELRAAAERLRALFSGEKPGERGDDAARRRVHDYITLARAYLAGHPADDGEPASWPWLGRVGFREASEGRSLFHSGPFALEICGGAGGATLWLNGVPVCDDPTRGDVRRLLAGLGVPLKEVPHAQG